MADITTVSTDFPTNYGSTALVNANTPFTLCYGTVTVASNALNVPSGTSFANGANTAQNYTWSGGGFYFKPVAAQESTAATNVWTYIAIVDGSSTDDSIRIGFDIDTAPATPQITCIAYAVDNTYADVGTPVTETYVVGTNHAWLGWYYDSTNVYWVRSSNGTSWTTMRTVTKTSIAFVGTQSDLGFAYVTDRTGGSAAAATLDNVNINGTAPGAVITASPQPNQGYPSNNVLWSFW